MRADRPSITSMGVASFRALYTELPAPFGIASDPVAAALVPAPFALPSLAARRLPRAAALLHHAIGAATFGLSYHVALRTRAIDDALREALAGGAGQVVILGAGLDARAYRIEALAEAAVFEVDHPSTQRHKRARVAESGARPLARAVRHVPVDFERDTLGASLEAAGFSRKETSFWIWEGVTPYLSRPAIAATLRAVGEVSAPGSRVAATYVQPHDTLLQRVWVAAGRVGLSVLGEPIGALLLRPEMAASCGEAGFSVRSDENAADWAARYWPGLGAGPIEWERLVLAERAAPSSMKQ